MPGFGMFPAPVLHRNTPYEREATLCWADHDKSGNFSCEQFSWSELGLCPAHTKEVTGRDYVGTELRQR